MVIGPRLSVSMLGRVNMDYVRSFIGRTCRSVQRAYSFDEGVGGADDLALSFDDGRDLVFVPTPDGIRVDSKFPDYGLDPGFYSFRVSSDDLLNTLVGERLEEVQESYSYGDLGGVCLRFGSDIYLDVELNADDLMLHVPPANQPTLYSSFLGSSVEVPECGSLVGKKLSGMRRRLVMDPSSGVPIARGVLFDWTDGSTSEFASTENPFEMVDLLGSRPGGEDSSTAPLYDSPRILRSLSDRRLTRVERFSDGPLGFWFGSAMIALTSSRLGISIIPSPYVLQGDLSRPIK